MLLAMLLLCLGVASAATVVTLDSQGLLANLSYSTSSTVYPNILVTGNASTYSCWLWSNWNESNGVGSWHQVETNSGVANNTNTSFSNWANTPEVIGYRYTWDVKCNHSGDGGGAWAAGGNETGYAQTGGGMNFSVDITDPAVTINGPSNYLWTSLNTTWINLTVVDNNTGYCSLATNLNQTTNSTGTYKDDYYTYAYTSGTFFNFTFNVGTEWLDNNTGAYIWSYRCNDSAGNTVYLGSNYTFYVDTVEPSAFDFNLSEFYTNNLVWLFNDTKSTDYTPHIGWGVTTELNFSRYEINFYDSVYGNATGRIQLNITTRTTQVTNMSTLAADRPYFINIIAYDEAGNSMQMTTIDYKYTTDSTNRALKAGWNIIGNPGNALSLSAYLNYSGATTVSYWNASHQFQSHVSGGSYGDTLVNPGYPVLVYLSADTNFEDLVWNTTALPIGAVDSYQQQNITNSSISGNWNLVMMRDWNTDKKIGQLDPYINCNEVGAGCATGNNNATNVDYFSIFNNSASTGSRYIPVIGNWSINNGTTLHFGNVLWAFFNGDADSVLTINWTAVN